MQLDLIQACYDILIRRQKDDHINGEGFCFLKQNCTPSSVTTKEIVTCRRTFSFTFPIHQSQSNFQTDYERLQTRLGRSTFIFATSFQDRVLFRLTCTTANRDTKVKTQETLRTKKKPRIISSAKGSLLYCPLEICSVPCR